MECRRTARCTSPLVIGLHDVRGGVIVGGVAPQLERESRRGRFARSAHQGSRRQGARGGSGRDRARIGEEPLPGFTRASAPRPRSSGEKIETEALILAEGARSEHRAAAAARPTRPRSSARPSAATKASAIGRESRLRATCTMRRARRPHRRARPRRRPPRARPRRARRPRATLRRSRRRGARLDPRRRVSRGALPLRGDRGGARRARAADGRAGRGPRRGRRARRSTRRGARARRRPARGNVGRGRGGSSSSARSPAPVAPPVATRSPHGRSAAREWLGRSAERARLASGHPTLPSVEAEGETSPPSRGRSAEAAEKGAGNG